MVSIEALDGNAFRNTGTHWVQDEEAMLLYKLSLLTESPK